MVPDPIKLVTISSMMVGGGWMLLTARRREAGEGPHCMRCGYNVAMLRDMICPECGARLTTETISDGPPSRMSWSRFWLGAVLLFVPACWVVLDFALALLRMPAMPGG